MRLLPVFAAGFWLAACGTYEAVSTTGRSFSTPDVPAPMDAAALESAVHDSACPAGSLHVRTIRENKGAKYVVDGCGQRGVYECPTRADLVHVGFTETHSGCEMVLIGKFAY